MSEDAPKEEKRLAVTFPNGREGTIRDLKSTDIICISCTVYGQKWQDKIAIYFRNNSDPENPTEIKVRPICGNGVELIPISDISAIHVPAAQDLFHMFESVLQRVVANTNEFQAMINVFKVP